MASKPNAITNGLTSSPSSRYNPASNRIITASFETVDRNGMDEEEDDDEEEAVLRELGGLQDEGDQKILKPARSSSSIKRQPEAFEPRPLLNQLDNLEQAAAKASKDISSLLGGDQWKLQTFGDLENIKTRGKEQLRSLRRLVRISLDLPVNEIITLSSEGDESEKMDRSMNKNRIKDHGKGNGNGNGKGKGKEKKNGRFNEKVVRSLLAAFDEREAKARSRGANEIPRSLGRVDYDRAGEILRAEKEGDEDEEPSFSHSKPIRTKTSSYKSEIFVPIPSVPSAANQEAISSFLASRPPLFNSNHLAAASRITSLWKNEDWLSQSPIPSFNLPPITCRNSFVNSTLRDIAFLSPVEEGDTSNGMPDVVLESLVEAIQESKDHWNPKVRFRIGKGKEMGWWSEHVCVPRTLEILKEKLKELRENKKGNSAGNASRTSLKRSGSPTFDQGSGSKKIKIKRPSTSRNLGIDQDIGDESMLSRNQMGKRRSLWENEDEGPIARPSVDSDDFEVNDGKKVGTSTFTSDSNPSPFQRLNPEAKKQADFITNLLGGAQWQNQVIGQLGLIQSRGVEQLRSLKRLVEVSIQVETTNESNGLFNKTLTDALINAYHQRQTASINKGGTPVITLNARDYATARETLERQITAIRSALMPSTSTPKVIPAPKTTQVPTMKSSTSAQPPSINPIRRTNRISGKRRALTESDDEELELSISQTLPTPPTKPYLPSVRSLSDLTGLEPNALAVVKSVSDLLGGDGWRSQSIGNLGPITSRAGHPLRALRKLVETSMKDPDIATSRNGCFSDLLIEALIRGFDKRQKDFVPVRGGGKSLFSLGAADYTIASDLLLSKIVNEESWEDKTLLRTIGFDTVQTPAERFPLTNIGLTGYALKTARSICIIWRNDHWLTQAPLPGLSPISVKSSPSAALLKSLANLTPVSASEEVPKGFPPLVLRCIREAILDSDDGTKHTKKKQGWNQSQTLPIALKLLKEELGFEEEMLKKEEDEGEEVQEDHQMNQFDESNGAGPSNQLMDLDIDSDDDAPPFYPQIPSWTSADQL